MNTREDAYLTVAIAAARAGGDIVRAAFYTVDSAGSGYKKEADTIQVVTDADTVAETTIIATLKESFPHHAYFGEEEGAEATQSDYRWIIDPIDGTSNFARKVPFFCVSVGLTYKNEPVLGVVYQPISDELFVAEKGKGASYNGVPLAGAAPMSLETLFVTLDKGKSRHEHERLARVFSALTLQVRSMRMPGSSALQTCYVAAGKFDAALYCGVRFYDTAAAVVIAQEAGLAVTDFKGARWSLRDGDMLICPPGITEYLVGLVEEI